MSEHETPPGDGGGGLWPFVLVLLCPAGKLLVLGVGAATLGGLAAGAVAISGVAGLVLAGLYVRTRRRSR